MNSTQPISLSQWQRDLAAALRFHARHKNLPLEKRLQKAVDAGIMTEKAADKVRAAHAKINETLNAAE